jgi:hypothetical protein
MIFNSLNIIKNYFVENNYFYFTSYKILINSINLLSLNIISL